MVRRQWKSAAAKRILGIAGNPDSVDDAIKIVADHLLDGVACPPTDLNSIAPKVNVTEIAYEELPVSGELLQSDGGFKICCSSDLSPQRKRFTIAHEIAHAALQTSGSCCPRVGKELERICDMLATEILMPRERFLSWSSGSLTIRTVFELAKLFDTSVAAAAIRLAETRAVSVFEVEDNFVTWGFGRVRKGSVSKLYDELRDAIKAAFRDGLGERVVVLPRGASFGEWELESARTGNQMRRLFLLRPCDGSLAKEAYRAVPHHRAVYRDLTPADSAGRLPDDPAPGASGRNRNGDR